MLQCCISSSAFWKGDSWQRRSRKSRNKQNYLLKIYIFSSLIVFKCLIWWELSKDYIFHNFKKSMSANVMHHVYCRLLDIICTKVQGCFFFFFWIKAANMFVWLMMYKGFSESSYVCRQGWKRPETPTQLLWLQQFQRQKCLQRKPNNNFPALFIIPALTSRTVFVGKCERSSF